MRSAERGSNRALNALAAAAAVATILGFILAVVGWPLGGQGAPARPDFVPFPDIEIPEGMFAICEAASIALEPRRGPSGTRVTVTGSGFTAEREVDLTFHTITLRSARTDGDGSFEVAVRIPDAFDGFPSDQQFDIVARSDGVSCVDMAPFRLTS